MYIHMCAHTHIIYIYIYTHTHTDSIGKDSIDTF